MTLVQRRVALDCSRVTESLSDYLDGDLAGIEREAVEMHIGSCARCSRVAVELALTVQALHVLGQYSSPGSRERRHGGLGAEPEALRDGGGGGE
ncbi:MAG TPA: zf-HC2 domain-containing protein [Anaeromyxobacteraceae bacterium]|nr:zf-HC2 domain-containing protein [Anaeromyxobacteraceae bacterium]